ncbi:hypothetical protein PHJA_001302600 [Phtheirospermum japonicum]|uniref:DUF569 domain-containing protein n=1 Tax=Phtheirospermum japonicum TaxID=374723 RepID=A0A830BXT1_9LAMI|nr:hypothetical protein PHJA_001302600 [Phtheirospermum japonicum]
MGRSSSSRTRSNIIPPEKLLTEVLNGVEPAVPAGDDGPEGSADSAEAPRQLGRVGAVWENGAVKLKTRYVRFLRANGGLPPWRNSVTQDVPHRTATKEWVLWEVHVVEILPAAPATFVVGREEVLAPETTNDVSGGGGYSPAPASFSRQESNDYYVNSPPKGSDGRLIYFHIADENGQIDEGFEELCTTFKGNEVNELTLRLEEELGLDGVTVCARSPLNGKLYPLRLQLPPNNATMHVVVVPPSSQRD